MCILDARNLSCDCGIAFIMPLLLPLKGEGMQEQLDELVRNYFVEANYEMDAVPFGLTNLTKIVKINDRKYVLRIYNRYTKHVEGIELETRITSFLAKKSLLFKCRSLFLL